MDKFDIDDMVEGTEANEELSLSTSQFKNDQTSDNNFSEVVSFECELYVHLAVVIK